METYLTLRRPRRKLCYLTNKKSPCKQWAKKVSLEDVDGMFDDLDSSSHDIDSSPTSPLHANNKGVISPILQEGHLTVKPPVPGKDIVTSARRSLAPELDNVEVLNIPLKVHEPVKTSSPIEDKVAVAALGDEDNERALVAPHILNFEEPKADLVNIQIPQSNEFVTEEKNNSELESPPSKISLGKPTRSSHKKQAQASCKAKPPTPEKTPNRLQSLDKSKTPRQENEEPSVSAVGQVLEHSNSKNNPSFDKHPSPERATRAGKDIQTFLQKVRDAEKTKPAGSRGFHSLVKVAIPPPEPEDDFLIMEDDIPLIYIPCKSSSRKRQKESKTEQSSTYKLGLTNKVTMESEIETAEKLGELEMKYPEQKSQIKHKTKKKTVKKNKNDVPEPGDDRKVVKDGETKDGDNRATDKESTNFQKIKNKTQKSSEVKTLKSSKDGKKNVKRNTEHKDLASLSDTEFKDSSAQKEKALDEVKLNTVPAVSEGSSSEYSGVLEKRKRKQPRHWWLGCPQGSEDIKVTDSQPTPKKSKRNSIESRAVPSPAKKDNVLKKRNQKRPAPASSEQTNSAETKKTKRKVQRVPKGETTDRRKTKQKVLTANDVDDVEDHGEQQDVPALDQEHENLSPLVFPQRELSLNSGHKVFQEVYRHVANEQKSSTTTPVSHGRLQQQQQQPREEKTDKRRRNPPSKWWLIDDNKELEHSSSQPQKCHHNEPRPPKERKNGSKKSRPPRLGTPKNGNMAGISKPPLGTATPPLKVKPLSAPKTVKRSLATFKDIFSSANEAEAEIDNKETWQNNGRIVQAHSAAEVSVFLQNHNTSPDSNCQSDNMITHLKSGPSSMVQLEQYEDDEDLILPSSRLHAALSMSDLCAMPLKPLILQPKDKANLAEWFKSLWPSSVPNAPGISPNEFDWYFYQGRAIGFLFDVNCGSACIGRILLGSHAKKPLWVDHSAFTVFNLLTSSVTVVIDSRESHFHAGQSFTVQCGHAYSIQNITAEPAVLYFTRIMEGHSD